MITQITDRFNVSSFAEIKTLNLNEEKHVYWFVLANLGHLLVCIFVQFFVSFAPENQITSISKMRSISPTFFCFFACPKKGLKNLCTLFKAHRYSDVISLFHVNIRRYFNIVDSPNFSSSTLTRCGKLKITKPITIL